MLSRFVPSSLVAAALGLAIVLPAATSEASGGSCANGKLWLGFSNPPRLNAPLGYDDADARSIANWSALAVDAGGVQNLPIHMYLNYVPAGVSDLNEQFWESEVKTYAAMGYRVLVTVHATPSAKTTIPGTTTMGYVTPAPSDYASFIKGLVDRIGSSVEAIEITNEGNVTIDDRSDGAAAPYQPNPSSGELAFDIAGDIAQGVVAAHDEAAALGEHIKVGFNWAYDYNAPAPLGTTGDGFWNELSVQEGVVPRFAADLDFMGEHTYPNFGSYATGTYGMTPGEIAALNEGRKRLSSIGLPASLPIRVTEVGYPTNSTATSAGDASGNNSQSAQAAYWNLVIAAAQSVMLSDNVSTVYGFLYQVVPSSQVPGDFGVVYPVDTAKTPGALPANDMEGEAKLSYPVLAQLLASNDPHPAGCSYSG